MPFPKTPREHYQQNPLEEVICQLRFPAILKIASDAPADFQEAIRNEYPLYEEVTPTDNLMAEIPQQFRDILGSLSSIGGSQPREYRFSSTDGNRVISLGRDFLAFSEKNYVSWSEFRPEVERAVEALRLYHQPAFYNRIGLRYRDALDKNLLELEDSVWADLLKGPFVGELGDEYIGKEVKEIMTQSLVELPDIKGGFVRMRHGLGKKADAGAQIYVIDVDFYSGKTELDDAFRVLDLFNKQGAWLFRWAISSGLRKALRPVSY